MSVTFKSTTDTSKLNALIKDAKKWSRTKYVIHDGVNYGIYYEFGTKHMSGNINLTKIMNRYESLLPRLLEAAGRSGVQLDVVLRKAAFDIKKEWVQDIGRTIKHPELSTGQLQASIDVSEEAM